ncbi:pilus assembly protein [Kordiimonas sp. SCSIO 12603]|uniref:TadE/TadG family type IV pilus assembly protein n=1 Tax=Kordiimonas sp. SCSIO 12603 TaxID=2829596 RepID=UPI00210488DB|nr:TadE/TadG family type IV pilus assembly protein [Kordiimonas sp. SCSIO 12603]UTW59839.1 pilus assembly protein [Kordiimonas sp. SCSIO 12603]
MSFLSHIWSFKKRLQQDEEGAIVVETAIGLPVLLTTMIGVLEIAHYFFVAAAIENAVLQASRFGITGSNEEGTTREQQVRDIIREQTFGQVNMDTVNIETLVYENFADIGEPEPFIDDNASGSYDEGEDYTDVNGNGQWDADMAISGLGGGGDIVLYRVNYDISSLTGFADWAYRNVSVSATVAVRNEPY